MSAQNLTRMKRLLEGKGRDSLAVSGMRCNDEALPQLFLGG